MKSSILVLSVFWSTIAGLKASGVSAQNALDKIISIELKDVLLREALNKISNVAEVSFVYVRNTALDKNKVSLVVRNQKVGEVLSKLLTPYSLSYTVIDNRIVIRAGKPAKQAASPADKPAHALIFKDISGIVTTDKGVALPGVSVLVKGSQRGVATNENGAFEIKELSEDAVLILSVTGFRREEVRVAASKGAALRILLREEAANLEEVVVTGFQQVDKNKFGGASVRLKGDEIKMDGIMDVSRMLEGRAAGVTIQNVSGTFGTAPKVRVRGATSINGDNKPLWVVDGVVLEDIVNISNDQLSSGDPTTLLGSAVAGLNANDIESFDILKDAAATAMYGARAMNGVVVITTKKGQPGKTAVTYTGNFSTQLKPVYRDYNIMNSAQQMSVLGELERKGTLNTNILDWSDNGVYGKMYDLLNADDSGHFLLENTSEAKAAFLTRYAKANTDWFSLLFRNNFMQEHSLSISSGTDKSQSYFSTSYYGDNGWTVADKVSRYTLNYRNTYRFSDKLSAGFSTVASVRQQRAPGALARNSNPVEGKYDRDFDINPFSYSLNTSRTLTAFNEEGKLEYFRRNFAPFNILNELKNNYIDLSVVDLRFMGDLSYKISKHLRYEFVGALRYVKSSREHQITEHANMAEAYRSAKTSTIRKLNKFLYQDPDNPEAEKIVVLPFGGFYNRTEDMLLNFDFRNSLNYSKTFNDAHSLNIFGGQQVKYADRQHFSNTGYGYQYDNGGVPFVDYRILKQTIENNFPYYGMSKDFDRFMAFYGSASYSYDAKYHITGNVRYDGSNRLGEAPRSRWLPTWSVAGSWNMERESFMERFRWLDFLTVRGAYGLTASMGPATNSNIVLKNINTNRPYLTEVESVIQLANLENTELTWEKLYTTNLGMDAGFFKRRLNVSVDVYQRKSFDLISLIKTSGIGGEARKAANYADMKSRGIEVLAAGDIIRRKNWNWKSNLTVGYNTTKITNVKNVPNIFSLVVAEGGAKEGYPVRGLFSIQYNGLDPRTGAPTFINQNGKNSSDVYLQDEQTQYLVYEGPVDPPFSGGFSNTFTWKAFSLNVFITYQAGNKIRLYPAFKTSYSDLDAMPREFYDRWMIPGDETKTNVPSILDAFTSFIADATGAYPYNNYNYSTERVAKGDLIRLKAVSLTYQAAGTIFKQAPFRTLSFTLAATNPWLLYADRKLKGQDPEFFNSGGVAQPVQKQFTLSIKAGL